jgi:hypothetical protein
MAEPSSRPETAITAASPTRFRLRRGSCRAGGLPRRARFRISERWPARTRDRQISACRIERLWLKAALREWVPIFRGADLGRHQRFALARSSQTIREFVRDPRFGRPAPGRKEARVGDEEKDSRRELLPNGENRAGPRLARTAYDLSTDACRSGC